MLRLPSQRGFSCLAAKHGSKVVIVDIAGELHYANIPMHYAEIFKGFKNAKF